MGWLDSLGSSDWGDYFGTGYDSSWYSGSSDNGFDWSNVDLGSVFGDGNGDISSGGGGSGNYSWLTSMLGGSGSGQGGSGNIFGALLSGLASGAGSWLDSKNAEKAMKMKGEQDRKTLGFGADLQDYYAQKNKARKRVALDTYGQFSQLDRWAPNYQNTPAVEVPAKPNAGSY